MAVEDGGLYYVSPPDLRWITWQLRRSHYRGRELATSQKVSVCDVEHEKEDLVEGMDVDGLSFDFIKMKNWMRLLTNFDVEITMINRELTIRIPKQTYLDNIGGDGLCNMP